MKVKTRRRLPEPGEAGAGFLPEDRRYTMGHNADQLEREAQEQSFYEQAVHLKEIGELMIKPERGSSFWRQSVVSIRREAIWTRVIWNRSAWKRQTQPGMRQSGNRSKRCSAVLQIRLTMNMIN